MSEPPQQIVEVAVLIRSHPAHEIAFDIPLGIRLRPIVAAQELGLGGGKSQEMPEVVFEPEGVFESDLLPLAAMKAKRVSSVALRLSRRQRQGAAIALAVLLIGSASAAYLHWTLTSRSGTTPSASTINPPMLSFNPASYDFVTPSTGWASIVVSGPTPETGRFGVFRTVDGAKHWQLQLTGDSSVPGFSPIVVQFFGKTRGFMTIGGPVEQLYRSDDGGSHWGPLVLPVAQIESITFSSETYGWVLASASSGRPGQRFNLYATSDAGQMWQRLPDPPADTIGLSFRRPTEAWIGSFGPGPPHVYTSSDAGQSWQRHDLPAPPGGSWDPTLSYQAFGNLLPGTGVMVGASGECGQPGCSPPGSFYFTSFDGGVHWRSIPSLPGLPAYQDSMNWWAMSANAVSKSRDAGRSWKQVATLPEGQQFSIAGIVDSTHAWASFLLVGGYGLAFTNDGGLHWTLAKVPQPL